MELGSRVPELSEDTPSGTIIRHVCMVQDVFGQEIFMKEFKARNEQGDEYHGVHRYCDVPKIPDGYTIDYNSVVHGSRLVYYCVPVPGQTSWTKPIQKSSDHVIAKHGKKRPVPEDMDTSEDNDVVKKSKESGAAVKKEATEKPVIGLNKILPTDEGCCCVLLLYDVRDNLSPYKVNDVVEIDGVVDRYDISHQQMEGETSKFPPASIVPRFHCLNMKKLLHLNPNSLFSDDTDRSIPKLSSKPRRNLLYILRSCFLGDPLVAEYVLLNIISSIYARRDDVMALGKFCINVSKCPAKEEFREVISTLFAKVCEKLMIYPLTVENLNNSRMIPKKDYNANRLLSGLLQLSDGTNIILDETQMTEGQLMPNGVENLKSLGNLILWQKLTYDFGYNYNLEFFYDVKVLVLSEGKSLLPSDVHIPMRDYTESADYQGILEVLNSEDEDWDNIRNYLTLIQLMSFKELSSEVQEKIEKDFVEERKKNPKDVTGDTLHRLLVTTRLIAISHGRSSITEDDWEKAKALERDRVGRFE